METKTKSTGRDRVESKDGPISANVDPHTGAGENMYGVFGTAAIHYGLGRLFVGIGGYGGAIDTPTTPFVRALDWATLADAWPTILRSGIRTSFALSLTRTRGESTLPRIEPPRCGNSTTSSALTS